MRHCGFPADVSRVLTRRLVHDEQGIALVLALVTLVVLSLTTVAVLTGSALNHRSSLRSAEAKRAFALAELALAYAQGSVYSAASTHKSPLLGDQPLPAQAGGGSGTYSASVASDGVTWTMVGTGTFDGTTRTVKSQANVPSQDLVQDKSVWNYLYADSTTGKSTNTCETTINGGTTVSVPLFTRDNLCITGGAHYTGTQIEVGGNLTVNGGANVGTSGSPLDTLNIAGTKCTNGTLTVAPATGVCDGTHAAIYASHVGTTLGLNPGMPTVALAQKYSDEASAAKSGCPAGLFDNDSTLNNSMSAATLTAKLFPYSYYPTPLSYDCFVGSSELKWKQTSTASSSGTLYVSGTDPFYFDGSLALGNGQQILYTGQGSLYFTGTASIAGGASFCGIAGCTRSWNPDVNGLILIFGCWKNSPESNPSAPTLTDASAKNGTYCLNIGGGDTVQFGSYVTTDYLLAGGGTNMGPVLAKTLTLGGGGSTLIPFHTMPPGTPLNTQNDYIPATPPTNWNG
jgi:hypothetical protein